MSEKCFFRKGAAGGRVNLSFSAGGIAGSTEKKGDICESIFEGERIVRRDQGYLASGVREIGVKVSGNCVCDPEEITRPNRGQRETVRLTLPPRLFRT